MDFSKQRVAFCFSPSAGVSDSEQGVNFRAGRVELRGFLESGQRIGSFSLPAKLFSRLHQKVEQIAADVRRIGLEQPGLAKQGKSFADAGGLPEQNTQEMNGVGLIWVLGEDRSIDRLGFSETAGLMQLQGLLQRGLDRVGRHRFDE